MDLRLGAKTSHVKSLNLKQKPILTVWSLLKPWANWFTDDLYTVIWKSSKCLQPATYSLLRLRRPAKQKISSDFESLKHRMKRDWVLLCNSWEIKSSWRASQLFKVMVNTIKCFIPINSSTKNWWPPNRTLLFNLSILEPPQSNILNTCNFENADITSLGNWLRLYMYSVVPKLYFWSRWVTANANENEFETALEVVNQFIFRQGSQTYYKT